ncbi:hypothetical protein ACFE04_026996 [Oxalis oulophora]
MDPVTKVKTHEHFHHAFELHNVSSKVQLILKKAGFKEFLKIEHKVKQVHALNTFLKRCYVPEEQCFLFGDHKWEYGLKDIAFFYGLPIEGKPVECADISNEEAESLCLVLLGDQAIFT